MQPAIYGKVRAIRQRDPGAMAAAIGREVGVSRERIRQVLVALNLPTRTRKWTDWRGLTMEERFWRNVDRSDMNGCWVWTAHLNEQGYGGFFAAKDRPAHQVSWEIYHGRAVPKGHIIRHDCDNPPCVNPSHLTLDTPAGNMQDAARKGRLYYQKHPEEARGERNPSAKLTWAQVREIRASHHKRSARELSMALGISLRTIYSIWSGELWREGQGPGTT